MFAATRSPGRGGQPGVTLLATPVSSMRSFWGLLRAYGVSESWREAWALTAAVALLSAAASKSGVWLAQASGAFISTIASFHDLGASAISEVLTAAGVLVGLAFLKFAVFIGFRHFFSTTLHRRWRRWLDGQFNAALGWDVSASYGRNAIDYGLHNSINASLGPNSPTSFNLGRLTQEVDHHLEALVGVVDHDVLLADRREAIAVVFENPLGIARRIGLELEIGARLLDDRGEARKMVVSGAVMVGEEKATDIEQRIEAAQIGSDGLLLRKGKKSYCRLLMG